MSEERRLGLCYAVLCCAVLCCAMLCCAGGRGCCTACPHSTDTLTQAETHKETDMYTKHAFTLCIESPTKHTTHTPRGSYSPDVIQAAKQLTESRTH